MDIRYSANPQDVRRYTTEELRKEFLITDLYQKDTVQATYSHVDRMVVMGIMPVDEVVSVDKGIDVWKNFGTQYFLERREAGVFNLGGDGYIVADGQRFDMTFEDCLYITMGTKEVKFGSKDKENPAKFYLCSSPAHRACKTTFISFADAQKRPEMSVNGTDKHVGNHPEECRDADSPGGNNGDQLAQRTADGAGGGGSHREEHQADALPRIRQQPHRGGAGAGGGKRQGRAGACGTQGAL